MNEAHHRVHRLLTSLHRRQAAVLAALLLIALAGYQAQDWLVDQMFDDGILINVAGRQRMLSQRVVAFAYQMEAADNADDRSLFMGLMAKAGSEMAAGHARLLRETERRGMSEDMRALYFSGIPSLDAQLTAYVAAVHALAEGGRADGRMRPACGRWPTPRV